MVIWVYYAAQIFYFGAEFTHVVALSRPGTSSKNIAVPASQKREQPLPPPPS
jgi:uncharacterized BrkB/YihY/UPF0761 family membrane protein